MNSTIAKGWICRTEFQPESEKLRAKVGSMG